MREFYWGKYFTRNEFECSHTHTCEMNQDFIDKLNKLREEFGKPLIINSGYRSPEHPIEYVKQSPGAHASGKACDISVSRADALKLLELALKLGFTGYGLNQKGSSRYIHLDTLENSKERPRPSIWTY
tara:strand:+ start:249 stop:632 length:384 start_codon:yes stop_codon:yes gene_type:complete